MADPVAEKLADVFDFPNGWRIMVHEVKDGEVYFQRWPPGIENQPFLSGLARMPIEEFKQAIAAEYLLGNRNG